METDQIEFRGKDAENGKWRLGFYFLYQGRHCIMTHGGAHCYINKETVGQWTGENNYSKEKVFSGDVLKFMPDGHLFLVCFRTGEFYGKRIDGTGHIPALVFKDCETLGNKFDNPELLEVK